MSHYWTADDPIEGRREQLRDWIEDVGEFPPAIVAEACREWRRKPSSRRPLPGDIRAICVEYHRLRQERRAIAGPTDMDEYARSLGFVDNAQRMAEIKATQERLNGAANIARLHRLREEMALQSIGKLRPVAQAAPDYSQEAMRKARAALQGHGMPPEPEPSPAPEEALRSMCSHEPHG